MEVGRDTSAGAAFRLAPVPIPAPGDAQNDFPAFIAYKRAGGACDQDLIRVTTAHGLFKDQARYLVEKQDLELWATVLTPPEEEQPGDASEQNRVRAAFARYHCGIGEENGTEGRTDGVGASASGSSGHVRRSCHGHGRRPSPARVPGPVDGLRGPVADVQQGHAAADASAARNVRPADSNVSSIGIYILHVPS